MISLILRAVRQPAGPGRSRCAQRSTSFAREVLERACSPNAGRRWLRMIESVVAQRRRLALRGRARCSAGTRRRRRRTSRPSGPCPAASRARASVEHVAQPRLGGALREVARRRPPALRPGRPDRAAGPGGRRAAGTSPASVSRRLPQREDVARDRMGLHVTIKPTNTPAWQEPTGARDTFGTRSPSVEQPTKRRTCRLQEKLERPGWIRTNDLRIRSPLLYPAELQGLAGAKRSLVSCGSRWRTPGWAWLIWWTIPARSGRW